MPLEGLIPLTWVEYLVLTLVLTHLTIISVTVYLHRHQAHRALKLHPVLSHFFRFWLWFTTGMVTREWVAVHRKHHAYCETEDDPHSPQIEGISKVVLEGSELYREAIKDPETIDKFGSGTPDDWLEKNVYQPHNYVGITVMLLIELLLFGPAGLVIWAVQMIWIPFWAAGVINGIGHYWGYRNFEIPNTSTNILPWGILIGGEELHNNHHAYGSSAKLSNRWWEFDLGWFYIRVFTFLRLAHVDKVSPKRTLLNQASQLDLEAIKALTVNRLQLFSDYRRKVLKPAFKVEIQHAPKPLKRIYRYTQRLARRDIRLLSDRERERIAQAIEGNSTLTTVYQYMLGLQRIWEQNGATGHEKKLEALRLWCKQAESSGVAALEEFVQLVRRYSLSTAR